MNVLIAEDNALVRELLKRFLAPICSSVPLETQSMEETEKIFCNDLSIDLMTLDLRFPDSTYENTILKVKSFRVCNPGAIIIVITGNLDPTLETRAMDAGAHGFMFKPNIAVPDSFMKTLVAVANSLLRQPTKYQRNLELAEKLVEKVKDCMPLLEQESCDMIAEK